MNRILTRTRSICPVCHRPVEAFYTEESVTDVDRAAGKDSSNTERVFFVKECPEHGRFKTLAAENAEDYKRWIKNPVVNIPPKGAQTGGDPEDAGCPLHCGTCENHLQTACCVLIDVTDRCDQHCPYCFACSEMDASGSSEPSLTEMAEKFDHLLALGEERPFNIQLSGGEPAVRDDLPQIIQLARQKGFAYVQINTNGKRLALEEGYAQRLKDAGASVIFLQFDGTRDEIYLALRGEPLLEIKKKAVHNCEKAGLPVTLVPTIVQDVNTDNIGEMMDFLIENVNVVKGIHFQPVSFFGRHPGLLRKTAGTHNNDSENFPERITMFGLLRKLEEQCPQFRYEDFCPITTGHTLCCFYSTYVREPDGRVACTLSGTQKEADGCCDMQVSSMVDCCGMTAADSLEVIRKDRDFVRNKWEIIPFPEDTACCADKDAPAAAGIMDLDQFLRYYRQNTFTVTGMAFQDGTNIDAERVKRCRVQQLAPDGRLIPFCAYNTIYRGGNRNDHHKTR